MEKETVAKHSQIWKMESKVKIPPGRVFQLPTELEKLWDGVEDFSVGARYGGEVKRPQMHMEMGGPKWDYKSSWFITIVEEPGIVRNGRVELVGPDMPEVEPGSSFPLALSVWCYGKGVDVYWYEYVTRTIGMYMQQIKGGMMMGAEDSTWWRVSKEAVADGINFANLTQLLIASTRTAIPAIEEMEFRWVVGSPEVGGAELATQIWEEVKEKVKIMNSLSDVEETDVDTFYGCTVCKVLAPNHICIISPGLIPYCGLMSYRSAQIQSELDPEGYFFPIPVGECLDPVMGEYSGVNEVIYPKTNYTVKRFCLNSAIKYPSTN